MKKWIAAGSLLAVVLSVSGQEDATDLVAKIDQEKKELVLLFKQAVPEEQGVLTIYAPNGEVLLSEEVEVILGTPFFRAGFSNWPSGIYTYTLSVNQVIYSQKFAL